MSDEKTRILEMVRDGKISAEDGVELLNALNDSEPKAPSPGKALTNRFLRVRVDSAEAKVNINIPLGLLKVASSLVNMGAGLIPEDARREMETRGIDITKIDFEELVNLIDQGLVDGKLVDVDVDSAEEGKVRVEVYVD